MSFKRIIRPFIYFLLFVTLLLLLLKFIEGRVPVSPPPPPYPTATGVRPTATAIARILPLIPYGMYRGPSYSHLKMGTTYVYKGTTYRLMAGAGGRLWGLSPQDKLVLLYGPKSQYDTY